MPTQLLLKLSTALFSIALLGGCVSTNTLNLKIESTKLGTTQPQIKEAVFLIREQTYSARPVDARFSNLKAQNVAAERMQLYADSLMAQLETRLPIMFQLNGISSRAKRSSENFPVADDVGKTERVIMISAPSAYSSTLTGTNLMLTVELLDSRNSSVVWRANIAVTELIFGEVSSKGADVFVAKLMEKMRSDKLVSIAPGAIRRQ